ncbi:MAG: bifunctional DNA-formamidopyrimidine glycosylase/DNA-(apurinic or apyrimidinic site) lyase [Acidobacteriota bacterium]|nr:bifunctional DNA-formamidopyrimidine glycosylase/DNA-(apurinic or apyrimidinic site) lyase [Acidobacteriota bacterium]
MPELPEVETVVRSVIRHIVGQRIRCVALSSARVTRGDRRATIAALSGAKITSVGRHGKQILIELDRGLLYVHLGMTGNLLWNATPGKHSRAVFELENGVLVYNDIRQFGRVEFYQEAPTHITRVGPDALKLEFPAFFLGLKKRKGPIKPLLLNQAFLSGVGNIYADEALYAARIHPRARAYRLSETRAKELYAQIQQILRLAIEHRGSSISNHVDACGEPGQFQQLHAVYGRTGEPCLRCGTPVRRIVLGQRGTHYCPRCQRA